MNKLIIWLLPLPSPLYFNFSHLMDTYSSLVAGDTEEGRRKINPHCYVLLQLYFLMFRCISICQSLNLLRQQSECIFHPHWERRGDNIPAWKRQDNGGGAVCVWALTHNTALSLITLKAGCWKTAQPNQVDFFAPSFNTQWIPRWSRHCEKHPLWSPFPKSLIHPLLMTTGPFPSPHW